MVDESVAMQQEILQKQQEAEQRVRRMREANRRLAQQMGAQLPEERTPPKSESKETDSGRWLPLILAMVLLKEDGPMELVLALLYLAL